MNSLNEVKTIHNEREFDEWFKENYKELGFTYVKRFASGGAPDYIAMRGKRLIRVELETLSSNFIEHKHSLEDVDLVLCVEVDKEIPVKTEAVADLKFWKPAKPRGSRSPGMDIKMVSDLIEVLLREEEGPISSQQIARRLGLARNTVYYSTTVLVAAGKIKRYRGLAGVFVPEGQGAKE